MAHEIVATFFQETPWHENTEIYIVEYDGAMWAFPTKALALQCCDLTWGAYGERKETANGVRYGVKYIHVRQALNVQTPQRLIY
jgi:hypothetical protein